MQILPFVMRKKSVCLRFLAIVLLCSIYFVQLTSAYYIADFAFTVPQSVYTTGERMELRGSLMLKNYTTNGTLVSNYTAVVSGTVNLTVSNTTTNISTYNFTTDSQGFFYSRSNFYSSAPLINAQNFSGMYVLRAEYLDPNNTLWFSSVEFRVVNQSIDLIRVSPAKTSYNPSESIVINAEAIRIVGDRVLYVSNVSINGSIQNVTNKTILTSFNCTTGDTGKCTTSVTAPSSYGEYFVEANNYKAFSRFSVIPFVVAAYMKDSVGKSYKNTFSRGEQASIEVGVVTNSSTETYTFSGYISDSQGNTIKTVDSTTLNTNNSYTGKFTFTVDTANFTFGTYYAHLTVSKSGDGSIGLLTSFVVKDWAMSVTRRSSASGFEYDYSTFSNKTLYFDIFPKYRGNGSIIPSLNSSAFLTNLTDNLNNNIAAANVSWNATCGGSGCYQFSFVAPNVTGKYTVAVTLTHDGLTKTVRTSVYVIDTVISAQATNVDGAIKELVGTNEFTYITLSSYNSSTSSINLSDAEIILVTYMNGTDMNYTNISYATINGSNTPLEWGWNVSAQRFRLDVP